MSFEAVPADNEPIDLNELLDFNENFRYTDLEEWQKSNLADVENTFYNAVSNKFSMEYRDSAYNITVDQNKAIKKIDLQTSDSFSSTGVLIDALLGNFNIMPCIQGFRKTFTCVLAVCDELDKADYFRLTTIDKNGWDLQNEEYVNLDKGAVKYSRWESPMLDPVTQSKSISHKFSFTNYSMCWLIESNELSNFIDRKLAFDMPMLYCGLIGQILMHQVGLLSVLSREFAGIQFTDKDNSRRLIEKLRIEFIQFHKSAWFNQITFAIQGREIYQKWREALEIDMLHSEVQDELREADDLLKTQHENDISRKLSRLQNVVFGFAGATFVLSALPGTIGSINADNGWDFGTRWWISFGAALFFGVIIYLIFERKTGKK